MEDIKAELQAEALKKGLKLSVDDPIFILIDVISFWIATNNEQLLTGVSDDLDKLITSINSTKKDQKSTLDNSIKVAKSIVKDLPNVALKEQNKIFGTELRKELNNYFEKQTKAFPYLFVLTVINTLSIVGFFSYLYFQ